MITENIRGLIEKHKIFYEIMPYFVLLDERPVGKPAIHKRVQAGFDINLYALYAAPEQPLRTGSGNEEFRATEEDLQRVAREIVSEAKSSDEIEITPFENSVILDIHQNLRPEAFLRIRITHDRGLAQPEGPMEEQTLAVIRERLLQLGVPDGPGGFSI